jgi:hypothetical protein
MAWPASLVQELACPGWRFPFEQDIATSSGAVTGLHSPSGAILRRELRRRSGSASRAIDKRCAANRGGSRGCAQAASIHESPTYRSCGFRGPQHSPSCASSARSPTFPEPDSRTGLGRGAISDTNDNVLYHSLSALASAEVNFWFTCRRKRLVARADGCGEGAG